MYFPLGWPKYLSVGQGKKSCLRCVVCNRYRMLFAVLTETTVSIWHCRPCVEIVCYQRCHASVASIGTNEMAEWRQDSSMLAVTTTEGYLLLYQLEQDVKGDKGLNLYEYHQTKTNQGDSNEVVPALRLTLKSNVNYKVPVTSLSCVRDELLVALMDGRLEILSWNNANDHRKSVALNDIPFSMDLHLSGTLIRERNTCPVQAVYSPFLEGFALVLSDGRAGLVSMTQSNDDTTSDEEEEIKEGGWKTRGIWAPGVINATCVAVNNKYRLIAYGTSIGDCLVFAIDDVTGSLTLSHTISLSPTQYPNICKSVGAVLKMEWSPDGCALALSWLNGGISVWSVFGSCLFCTLASDRSHASDGSPNIQGVFRSMCWGVEGYNLWLIGAHNTSTKKRTHASKSTKHEVSHPEDQSTGGDGKPVSKDNLKHNHKKARRKLVTENGGESPPTKINIETEQLLQIQFAKSALAMNPCMSNHCHVLMHSEDKIYLSIGERPQTYSIINPETSDKSSYFARRDSSLFPTYTDIPYSSKSDLIKPASPKHGSPRRKSVPTTNNHSINPIVPNHDNVTNTAEESTDGSSENNSPLRSAVANKQWTIIQLPLNYLPSNWPIRFAAVDETGCFLAIAGNFGLAHYTVTSRKWKVFGNIMQEKDMVVTGGLTWWEDYVVVACYNLSDNQDEIRLYPRLTNLDNAFACIKKVRSQILLVNIFQNLLVLFTYDCRILMFVLSHDIKNPRSQASVRFLQEVSIGRYVPYPTLVASVTLTALHMESAVRRSSSSSSFSSRPQKETEVLIINVAGRLLLLQGSSEDDEAPPSPQDDQLSPLPHERRQTRFTAPVVLASCVENIWTTQYKNRAKVHLTDALWLGCGGAGVRVWLPLFPPRPNRRNSTERGGHRGFELQLLTARRITLAFSLDSCYPLAVLFNEAVVLGVASETLQGFDENLMNRRIADRNTALQFSTIERTCEIYLHQILRQLLRRNLGYHALQLASTCQNLSCFPHVLELMLHEVLEEEATASEPIPDPLLPTVIKFLEEFPQYLETVVHCARKTEIALWEYLFNSVGSPRDLFEECLENGQLRTAASYLIILQNLEQLAVARQDATRLFDQALQKQQWALANEIARFLRAIGDGDACATPRHPTLLNVNIYPAVTPGSHHNTPTEPDPAFKFSDERKNLLMRQYSVVPVHESVAGSQKQRRMSTKSAPPTPAPQTTSFHGCSGGKTQTKNPNSPDDNPPVSAAPPSRRLTSRSYTESYFDLVPNSKPPPGATAASPSGQSSSGSSVSHPYVSRYQMRQYHQEHYPMHRPLQHSSSHPVPSSGTRSKRFSGDRAVGNKDQVAAECAEHYFLDVILARQARKMMGDLRLHDLGTFAACVNFQLVPWFRKERGRACRVDDAVACLKTLHSDFSWPYPNFFSSKTSRGSNSSSGGTPAHSRSFNDLGSLQNRLAALEVQQSMSPSRSTNFEQQNIPKSRNPGLRFSNLPNNSPKRHTAHLDNLSVGTDEDGTAGSGVLTVLTARETGSTLTLTTVASEMSEVSESSLTMDDSSFAASAEDMYGFTMNGSALDDKRGPARYEMKLQYLLELFLEALCMEWATLICLMLRDPSNMARLVRSAKLADPNTNDDDAVPLDTLQRTRECLTQIDKWAISECPGYKAVLLQVRTHLQELYDVINDREVSHAEHQAIVAKQQVSGVPATPVTNITMERSAWTSATIATATTTIVTSVSSNTIKRKLPAPGSAQQLTEVDELSVNGETGSDFSEVGEEEENETGSVRCAIPPSASQERTRHNSVPCENQSTVDTSHTRTPSSPANLCSPAHVKVERREEDFIQEAVVEQTFPRVVTEDEEDGLGEEEDGVEEFDDSDEYADSQDESTCTVS